MARKRTKEYYANHPELLPVTIGRPRRFQTEESFQECVIEYLKVCEDRRDMANISGFCVFADITRDTFYEYETYYPNSYKKAKQALEDRAINYKGAPAMAIFYLKNTFGYQDKPTENTNDTVEIDADDTEIDALLSKLGYQLLE